MYSKIYLLLHLSGYPKVMGTYFNKKVMPMIKQQSNE